MLGDDLCLQEWKITDNPSLEQVDFSDRGNILLGQVSQGSGSRGAVRVEYTTKRWNTQVTFLVCYYVTGVACSYREGWTCRDQGKKFVVELSVEVAAKQREA